MITSTATPSWKLSSLTGVLSLALAGFLFFLSARAAFDPVGAADAFGLPTASPDGLLWLRIKAGRDLGLGLIFMTAILLRARRVVGAITLASVAIPVVDGSTVVAHGARSVGFALAVHGSAALYGLALGAWLLASDARARREEAT